MTSPSERMAPEGAGPPSRAARPPRPAAAVLEADGLRKCFGGKTVLKSAGFKAEEGRVTALMGRNGSGKSTMLRIAIGRVRPEQGRVMYKGIYRERPSLPALAMEGLLYSAQESALTSHFTIGAHFDAFMRVFGEAAGAAAADADADANADANANANSGAGAESPADRLARATERMKLSGLLAQRPGQLSGGERQRASLGLAMLRSPDCLLMDEPFAGVAPLDVPLVSGGLRELADRGVAVVISGHDVDALFSVSDEVIWVTAGTTHWLGSPDEASRHDQFRREYLGPRGMRKKN